MSEIIHVPARDEAADEQQFQAIYDGVVQDQRQQLDLYLRTQQVKANAQKMLVRVLEDALGAYEFDALMSATQRKLDRLAQSKKRLTDRRPKASQAEKAAIDDQLQALSKMETKVLEESRASMEKAMGGS